MSRRPNSERGIHGIPEATVARLPVYLRALYVLADRGIATVSGEGLASTAGVNSAKLRKDLSHLGSYGTRGVGYDVEYLVYQVSRELGLTQDWPIVIIGSGKLGHALANYGGFASRGFRVAALFDADPEVVGTTIARHTVRHADEIEAEIARLGVSIGVIATPAAAAQSVCDRLVDAGVTSILNFAPVVLNVPSGVDVRKVDLSIELQILAFHAQRRAEVRAELDGQASWQDELPGELTHDGLPRETMRDELAHQAMQDGRSHPGGQDLRDGDLRDSDLRDSDLRDGGRWDSDLRDGGRRDSGRRDAHRHKSRRRRGAPPPVAAGATTPAGLNGNAGVEAQAVGT